MHLGAAKALEELAKWIHAPIGTRTDLARERWRGGRDILDALQPASWREGAPGGEHVAMALVVADDYRTDRSLDERQGLLATAEILSRGDAGVARGNVLKARGELRRFRADLEGAGQDYDQALGLYEAV